MPKSDAWNWIRHKYRSSLNWTILSALVITLFRFPVRLNKIFIPVFDWDEVQNRVTVAVTTHNSTTMPSQKIPNPYPSIIGSCDDTNVSKIHTPYFSDNKKNSLYLFDKNKAVFQVISAT